MNRIRLMPDYDALLVPKQIAIITESVQALNDICVSLETENAAIRMAAEQAEQIRTAAEALMEYVEKIPSKLPLMEHRDAKFLAGIIERGANLKAALSRGWLARKEPNSMCECGVPLYLHGSLTACCLSKVTVEAK